MIREYQRATADRRGFFPIDWQYFFHVTRGTLLYADDVKIRWLMAVASLTWGFELLLIPGTLERPFYVVMKGMAPAWVWAALFMVHGVGAIWRIYERKERERWAMFINGLGVAVWVANTVAQNIGAGRFVVTTSLEFIACAFLLGTFVSTGWTSKSTTV